MKMPNLFALRSVRGPARPPRSGFALIISLSLMTLLLLLVLTLSILVRLELQTATGNLYTEQAKQNALLGAYIALGQLQKFAGPDQRITTTADIGRHDDRDLTSVVPPQGDGGFGLRFTYVFAKSEGATDNMPAPIGAQQRWAYSGTLYWTMVWGHGTAPLSIYTGQDSSGHVSPSPILMNYLISGDEGTPLQYATPSAFSQGIVQAPDKIAFTCETGGPDGSGITRLNDPSALPEVWTALNNDLVIKPTNKTGTVTDDSVAAIVLVGPASAYTNAKTDTLIRYVAGNDPNKFPSQIKEYHPALNMVVVPMVNITIPEEGAATRVVGRYAFWVGDEGVKAKYNMPDTMAGAEKRGGVISAATDAAQALRYRFGTPLRAGIERMASGQEDASKPQMDSYVTTGATPAVNSPVTYDKNATALLSQVLDPTQVLLIDRTLQGPKGFTDKPEKVLALHYHDFTTRSYGVLADTLRGGLRYDLTSIFEPGTAADSLFANDPTNSLKGKSLLPTAANAVATRTSEPGAGNIGLRNRGDSSIFHGPAANDPSNPAAPGLKWDVLQSWYRISSFNTGGNPVQMRAGNATVAGVSPVILQARLKFGETVDSAQFQYVAVEPVFVLANPYNYPITPPPGGLDLGLRITADTGWEWGFHAIARNNDRVAPHGSGVGVYLGFDNTQGNVTNGPARAIQQMNSFTVPGGNNSLTNGYNGAYFYTTTAVSQITPVVTGVQYGGGNGNGVRPGYYPFLKNPVSYTQFISSMPGAPGSQGNSRFNSVLDQVAFHIPKFINGVQTIWQPGEAIVFTLADETSGGNNFTSQIQPLAGRYNQMSTTQRKITSVVGTVGGSTSGLISLQVNEMTPVLLKPGALPSNAHYFMLRYTGIKTASDSLQSYATTGANTIPATWNLAGNPATPNAYGANASTAWPDPSFGYISTAWPSVSATLELRYDPTVVNVLRGSESYSTLPVSANIANSVFTSGIATTTPISAAGVNVLQTITNFDLSGAGLTGHTYVPGVGDPAGYLSPTPPQGYRRQFLGTGTAGSTTVPTLNNGVLPVFLTSYVMSMALPGSMDPLYFAKDAAPTADSGVSNFDPNLQVSYRTYMDFNIRAVNLSLPPTAPLNPATTSPNLTSNTAAFITAPPFGRVWNQGPAIGGGSGDDVVQASYNPLDDQSFNTKNVGPNFTTFTGNGSTKNYGAPWGNSLSTVTSGNATAGQQYNILFALPTRLTPATNSNNPVPPYLPTVGAMQNVPNPNAALDTSLPPNLPDIALMSLGQLQHADMTADDVWVSVGYQRGNAIGNSYWTPFVNRNSSMGSRPLASGLVTKRITGVTLGSNTTTYGNIGPTSGNVGIYDISYLLNCALFDRYFFSTLGQSAGSTTVPANGRLKYAMGIIPTLDQLSNGKTAVTVADPVTGGTMFRAYAPARYMMIDGAFNVNSTSFEAWRAVLSGMRNAAMSTTYVGSTDASGAPATNGRFPVVYVPRALPSDFLANATAGGSGYTSMISNKIYQPIKMSASFMATPSSTDTTGKDPASYAGFRQLTDADIDSLAMKIVQQVHLRGPFLSLAQFVNRRLTLPASTHALPYQDPLSWSGALQTAIDLNTNPTGTTSNSLNNFYLGMVNGANPTSPLAINSSLLPADSRTAANANQTYPEGPAQFQSAYPRGSADPNSRLVGIPGWLTQADLLESLAPILAVRSDTFVIRTYGEVISASTNQQRLKDAIADDPTKILSRAWCEVVVQRIPDYLATDAASINDPTATAGLNAPNPAVSGKTQVQLSPVNVVFGRRFKVVSVRWLNANDI